MGIARQLVLLVVICVTVCCGARLYAQCTKECRMTEYQAWLDEPYNIPKTHRYVPQIARKLWGDGGELGGVPVVSDEDWSCCDVTEWLTYTAFCSNVPSQVAAVPTTATTSFTWRCWECSGD